MKTNVLLIFLGLSVVGGVILHSYLDPEFFNKPGSDYMILEKQKDSLEQVISNKEIYESFVHNIAKQSHLDSTEYSAFAHDSLIRLEYNNKISNITDSLSTNKLSAPTIYAIAAYSYNKKDSNFLVSPEYIFSKSSDSIPESILRYINAK